MCFSQTCDFALSRGKRPARPLRAHNQTQHIEAVIRDVWNELRRSGRRDEEAELLHECVGQDRRSRELPSTTSAWLRVCLPLRKAFPLR